MSGLHDPQRHKMMDVTLIAIFEFLQIPFIYEDIFIVRNVNMLCVSARRPESTKRLT